MKKLITLLLLGAMLLSTFASCGESTANADETTADAAGTPSAEEVAETEAETELTHGLPEKDFGGADYVGLIRTSKLTHFTAEEMTGEALNDAVYERNNTVSEEFGVTLGFVNVEDNSGTFNNTVSQSIMAQDAAYDVIAPDYWWATEINGWFLNLMEMEYLNLAMPWWCGGWIRFTTRSIVRCPSAAAISWTTA